MSIFIRYYFPPILIAIIIFILSAIPGNDYPTAVFNYSWLAHLVEFGLLAFLTLRAFRQTAINRWQMVFWSLILTALYAASDEYHQLFVSERSVSFVDWLVDLLGILTGLGIYLRRAGWYSQPETASNKNNDKQ